MEHIVHGCRDCPMCDMNDMSSGFTCRLNYYLQPKRDTFIHEDKYSMPITPDSCPLKTETITISIKGDG